MGAEANGGGKPPTAGTSPAPAEIETAPLPAAEDGAPPLIFSLVLPCPLRVLGTVRDAETGRPLGELLRAVGAI